VYRIQSVTVTFTAEDARELVRVLYTRPHNEGWSDRILEEIESALELPAAPERLRA